MQLLIIRKAMPTVLENKKNQSNAPLLHLQLIYLCAAIK
jgi:hypothetical protein